MNSTTTEHRPAEESVRAAAAALVSAFAEGRLDDYFAAFAPDATFLFPTTTRRLTSVTEYRELWQRWVTEDGFRVLDCASTEQLIQPLGDTAVFSHHVTTRITTHTGEETLTERETIIFTRRTPNGPWLAVHEHLSTAV
ncbi:DUF4440 domain-containing protein [Streptomyces paludis]|uniref:DUF4440 domain-containing protein n=2 Tax=Streptomyces paludis TaxID=2282738 RepID=A0A345I1Y2_9ACTN|nr:DUF4440 domain-containing protein [Streptomyces paludis]